MRDHRINPQMDEAATPEDAQAENEIIAEGPAELDPVAIDVNGSEQGPNVRSRITTQPIAQRSMIR
jgi:hypothetical protein